MSVILDPEARGAIAEIFAGLAQPTPKPSEEEWLVTLVAWIVDDQKQHKQDDARFAELLQLTWNVGSRLEAELCGRFKRIIAVSAAVFPFDNPSGELAAGVVDTVKLSPMSDDPREITCALAAEMMKADASHNTLYIHSLIRKDVRGRYSSRFATAQAS